MFQTEIVLFLQSLGNDTLTFIFKLFSDLGLSSSITPLVIAITVGVHFRIGILLMHTLVWSGLAAQFFKEVFALPRPANVDSAVRLLAEDFPNPTHFKGMGAGGFFETLPRQVVDFLRSHRIDSFGLPSGHTAAAVALWGSISLYFKKTWVRITAAVFLVCIPLSRIYLGRHFLADVLGGFLLGVLILSLFYRAVYRNEALKAYLFEKTLHLRMHWKSILTTLYFLVIPFLLLPLPLDSWEPKNEITLPATLLGINIAYLLLWKRGLPEESGTFRQRVLRAVLGLLLFVLVGFLLKNLSGILFTREPAAARFVRLSLTFFLSLWGGVETAVKLKLFERKTFER